MLQSIIELKNIHKTFGSIVALTDITFDIKKGEVHCLLGDNGAGKSTLIKILSGVHQPTGGKLFIDGTPILLSSPRDAIDLGLATVFQDLAMSPLMSITRNFFMGREPVKGRGILQRIDMLKANQIALQALSEIGIDIRDPSQSVGTLSGGERQCVAIARAVHFGARVLILDEPTSALGVHQASLVLKYIAEARSRNLGIVFITHNIQHAFTIGDRFTLLNRGTSQGTFKKTEISQEEVLQVMAGGEELQKVQLEIEKINSQSNIKEFH
jgi:simple sugar transport system ATP-binding protein